MLTARAASDLLRSVTTPTGVGALLDALGFAEPVSLDVRALLRFGLNDVRGRIQIARRRGALRVLVAAFEGRVSLRDEVPGIAGRLASRAPQFTWLILAIRGDGGEASLSSWEAHGTSGRHAALVFEPARPRASDAEMLVALAAAAPGDDALVHHRWHEILGRQVVSARFYRALESAVVSLGEGAEGRAPAAARRELALVAASRLLFLSFLQVRGWLDGDADFLVREFERALAAGGNVHARLLEPLFFGTLNARPARRAAAARAFGRVPFLNGGLFARSPLERTHRDLRFRDAEMGTLFEDVLTRYRFTPREERPDWSEAAIDPEILGRAFESLMASRERRETGAFFTPHALVVQATESALAEVLDAAGIAVTARETVLRGEPPGAVDAARVRNSLQRLRVLDPACGSGAFLVFVLERVSDALRATGDSRPASSVRRDVLTRSIFGVDVNPMAAWLCGLRLWLSVVIDLDEADPLRLTPLPNLDRNVRVGDTLGGGGWTTGQEAHGLSRLRGRYSRATGRRKATLARTLDRDERRAGLALLDGRIASLSAERHSLVQVARGRDLFGGRRGAVGSEAQRREVLRAQVREFRRDRRSLVQGGALPFAFASHFADVSAGGGFDLVIGNPPWVRLHRIPAERREALRRDFRVFREAAWKRGADSANAASGFAAQVDLAALFTERGLQLVRPGGTLALLLPVKLWRSLAGGGVRRLLTAESEPRVLEDWSEAPASFDAAVYPSLIVVRRATDDLPADSPSGMRVAVHRKHLAISWRTRHEDIALDESAGAPWLLLPPDARRALARLAESGTPLAESRLGQPMLGVKCGCNDAFVVKAADAGGVVAVVRTVRGNVSVEASLLRPVLRGESLRRWRHEAAGEQIIWTHDTDGAPLRALPAAAARWFGRWRSNLLHRSDARPAQAWWSLFRVEAAANSRPRVVWADLSRGPRACVLPARSPVVPLNSCYVLACRDDVDAAAFAALFNSPLVAGWFDAVAEPARGGFRRYLGWTVSRLPVPHDWARAREIMAPLGARAVGGETVTDAELLEAARTAYGVSSRTVAALLEWTWR